MNELASSMESTYSTAKICKYGEDLSNCEPSMSLGGKSYISYYQNESIEWFYCLIIWKKIYLSVYSWFFLDLSSFMAKNRSHEALKHVWVEWRKASGNKYKTDYLDFIDLNNEGAKELGKWSLFLFLVLDYERYNIKPCVVLWIMTKFTTL